MQAAPRGSVSTERRRAHIRRHRVQDHPVLLAVIFGAAVRFLVHVSTPLLLTPDSIHYWALAVNWAARRSLDTVLPYRTPMLPLLLGEAFRWLGESKFVVSAVQATLGLVTIACLTDVARRLLGSRGALLTGCVVALLPRVLFMETYLMTETLTTSGVAAFAWLLLRWELSSSRGLAFLAGVCGGIVTLTRPSVVPLAAAPMCLLIPGLVRRFRLISAGAWSFCAGLALTVLPWIVYVTAQTGSPSLTVATGWQWWVYQHVDGIFDPAVTSFAPYRRDYEALGAQLHGQVWAFALRDRLEREDGATPASVDAKFKAFAVENAVRHPKTLLLDATRSTMLFLGIASPSVVLHGESEMLMQSCLSSHAPITVNRIDNVEAFKESLHAHDVAARSRLSAGELARLEAPDPREDSTALPAKLLLRLHDAWFIDDWLLAPLAVFATVELHRHATLRAWSLLLVAGYVLTAVLHGAFLAHIDRYHWVFEPTLLVIAIVGIARAVSRRTRSRSRPAGAAVRARETADRSCG